MSGEGRPNLRNGSELQVHVAVFDAGVEEDGAAGEVAEAFVEGDGVELGGEGDGSEAADAGGFMQGGHDGGAVAVAAVLGEDGDAADVGHVAGGDVEEETAGGDACAVDAAKDVDGGRVGGGSTS